MLALLASMTAIAQDDPAPYEETMTLRECEALVEALETDGASEEASEPVLVASQTAWALVSDGEERALDLFDRIVVAVRDGAGEDSLLTATVLGLAGNAAMTVGGQDRAIPSLEEAVAILERAGEGNEESLSYVLDDLAKSVESLGQVQEAEVMLERVVLLRETAKGPDDFYVAAALNDLANVESSLGHRDDAIAHYERSLDIAVDALGGDHEYVASTQVNLGLLYDAAGDAESAWKQMAPAVQVFEAALDPLDPMLGVVWQNLALVAQHRGDTTTSVALLKRALLLQEGQLGRDHPEVGRTLANLGAVLAEGGDYVEARSLLERSLAIRIAAHGPRHPDVAHSYRVLGNAARTHGDLEAALPLLEEAVSVQEALSGPDHPGLAVTLANVATTLEAMGRYEEALPVADRAAALLEATWGERSRDALSARFNAANIRYAVHQDFESLATLREIAALQAEVLGPNHPHVASSLGVLAFRFEGAGMLGDALEAARQSCEIVQNMEGSQGPALARCLHALSVVHQARGEEDEAAKYAWQAHETSSEVLKDLWAGLSEREALAMVATHRKYLDAALAHSALPAQAYDLALDYKGIATRVLRARHRAVLQDDEGIRRRDALQATRRQLAQLILAPWTPEEADVRQARIAELTVAKEGLERQLAETVGVGRLEVDRRKICAALGEETALVDFLRWSNGDELRYLAFVIPAGDCDAVRQLDLGAAAEIDALAGGFRDALADTRSTTHHIDGRGRRLAEAVLEPVLDVAGDGTRLFIVPDGGLSGVAFGALPTEDGSYLVEHQAVSYLEIAGDAVAVADAHGAGLLSVGALDYGGNDAEHSVATRMAPCVTRQFPTLPATGPEADAVASRFARSRYSDEQISVRSGAQATATSVAGDLSGKRVVHLATHGFFAGPECRLDLAGGRSLGRFGGDAGIGFNPMSLSGIVLAGANLPHDALDPEDGILTAEEVAALDLRGTQLVVLSACDTGVGDVSTGEGVLGLRRAFSAAGAQTLVMSLWAVPDEATRVLMDDFYAAYLHKRKPKSASESLRAAQLEMLRSRRAKYGEARPQDWAAFIVSGP